MTSHNAELSRNMDRITQLQDGIDSLVTIMYSTIGFLTREADFKQLNPDIPITQTIPRPEGAKPPQETFAENCAELVQDFLKKAKQIEYLISILPPHNNNTKEGRKNPTDSKISEMLPATESSDKLGQPTLKQESLAAQEDTVKQTSDDAKEQEDNDDDSEEFERLQNDMCAAQLEYDLALLDAESLQSEIKEALDRIFDHRTKLLSSAL